MILTSSKTMTDNSIHQLRQITTHQQNAINSIQATLTIQQNDIADIKTSINHIINSLSDLASKLGLQVTLPPPLPLSPTPPTSLPATVSVVVFHFPAPPLTSVAAAPPPSCTVDAPPVTGLIPHPPQSQPPNESSKTISHPYAIGSEKTDITENKSSILLSYLARHTSFAEIESTTNGFYDVFLLDVGDLGKNFRLMFYKVLDVRPAMNQTRLIEQKWINAHNPFVKMNEPYFVKTMVSASKPLVFDPGGTFAIEFTFEACSVHYDVQASLNMLNQQAQIQDQVSSPSSKHIQDLLMSIIELTTKPLAPIEAPNLLIYTYLRP